MEVEAGKEVSLECTSQGAKPAAELVWRYGKVATRGFHIREDVTRSEDGRTWKTTSVFKFVPEEDQEVVCSVHSEAFPDSRDSRPLLLKLLHKPKVTLEASRTQLREGQDVTFSCTASASPADLTYTWFINDNEVAGQTEASLTLEMVGREHDGAVVRCRVENRVGAGEDTVELEVQYQGRILEQPRSRVAREGEEVVLKCSGEGSPAPQYAWLRLGEEGREEVVAVSDTLALTVTKHTEGRYLCKVFVRGHPALSSAVATVSLLRAPKVEVEEVVRARLGEAAVLQCRVTSLSPNTTVVWTRHPAQGRLDSLRGDMTRQRMVRGEEGVTILSDLILPTLAEQDFATYGCFAQNEAGYDHRMMMLEQEHDTDWISLIIAINTLLGLVVLAAVLFWHYRRKLAEVSEVLPGVFPREHAAPIFRGEDMAEIDNLLQYTENYGAISNEYFDPNQEKKIDLRIV